MVLDDSDKIEKRVIALACFQRINHIQDDQGKEKRSQDFFGTDKDGYFYFIFQDTDSQKGKAACERLKKKAEDVFEDVRISFSMAVFPEDGESPDALLSKVRNSKD